jgi:hypothetical protein
MEIDWDKVPDEKGLGVFRETLQDDDRDFNDMQNRWPELFIEPKAALPDATILTEDYEDLPDLNPVTSFIADVRIFISKLGIPGLSIYHVLKVVGLPAASYVLCPGDHKIKAIAAGATAATVIAALPLSPTFYALGTLVGAKVGLNLMEKFKKPSPKP